MTCQAPHWLGLVKLMGRDLLISADPAYLVTRWQCTSAGRSAASPTFMWLLWRKGCAFGVAKKWMPSNTTVTAVPRDGAHRA